MPFVKADTPFEGGVVGLSRYDEAHPSFTAITGAAFRQENLIGSMMSNERLGLSGQDLVRVDPNYNPFNDIAGYERHSDQFQNATNPKLTAAIKRNIDKEERDRKTLAAGGLAATVMQVGAGISDPTILIPGGALVKGGKVGYRMLKSAGVIGGAAAVGVGLQEAALQGTQEIRPMGESLAAIGGSVILGGLLGAAGAKFFSKAEWGTFSRQLEDDLKGDVPNPSEVAETIVARAQAAGAANVEELDLTDLGIGGHRAAEVVARATAAVRLNPGVATMLSPSVKTREIYGKLVDNPIFTKMNMEGKSLGADVENAVKLYSRGATGQWIESRNQIWKSAKNEGFEGTLSDFNKRVAEAGRRGDVDPLGNAHVTRAAEDARRLVFDPLLERAKTLGLLPEDVKTTTAASYVTRLWNRQQLIGQEPQFREAVRPWFEQQMTRAEFKALEAKIGNQIAESHGLQDSLNKSLERLSGVESRLAGRNSARKSKLGRITAAEQARYEQMQGRAPKAIVDAIRNADGGTKIVDAVKDARHAASQAKFSGKPTLALLKSRGGVRVGSPLSQELGRVGVNPKTYPGLFKKAGGRGAADTILGDEHPFLDGMGRDANGYVLPDEIMRAVEAELGGSPLRAPDQAAAEEFAQTTSADAAAWLNKLGLNEQSTVGEIRAAIKNALGPEDALRKTDEKLAGLYDDLESFDRLTDEVKNTELMSKAEVSRLADDLDKIDAEIAKFEDIARESPRVSLIVDYAKTRREFGKARYDLAIKRNREKKLKVLDGEGKLTPELDAELTTIGKDITTLLAKTEKLQAKSDKLKPMLPKKGQPIPEFISEADRADYIEEAMTATFNNLTGRGAGDTPEWLVPVKRGPLKERTFKIPDELVEQFLENDMELIARRYARTMGAEVELTQKFGRADMQDQIAAIHKDYDKLAAEAKTDAERLKLDKQRRNDVTNIEAFRDMIRGTYRAADESSDWTKITRAALTWNYIRLLGGVVLSSLTDSGRLLGAHGMRATMREALPALVANTRAIKIARQDARDLGAVAETLMQGRLATLADLQDPYRYGSRYERFLSNASNIFTKATGLGYWNDSMKGIVAVMTQNRMARNALKWASASQKEKTYMAALGIDEAMAGRIAKQIEQHGVQEQGIWGANVSAWDDELARRAWGAALNKDVDRAIVTKGVADTPLWTHSNWGRLIMQFKSFALASHQRVLIAGLQQDQQRLAENMVFATAIGMMVAYLKLAERGDMEEADRLLANPGLWVSDGLDRTGIFSVLYEMSNTAEKLGAPVGITSAAQMIAGDKDRGGTVSRYASRNKLGAVLGPSAGMFEDLTTIASQLSRGDLKKSGANAIIRQVPGATLPGVRPFMQTVAKPALSDAVD